MEDFLAGTTVIPMRAQSVPASREERRNDGGLLSTLSSYLLSPYSGSTDSFGRDITDDDIESTLCSLDCIASCRVEDLYSLVP
jgi:golgi-specific brefeldin A-resistance guanine nucleotide exchange factor 1